MRTGRLELSALCLQFGRTLSDELVELVDVLGDIGLQQAEGVSDLVDLVTRTPQRALERQRARELIRREGGSKIGDVLHRQLQLPTQDHRSNDADQPDQETERGEQAKHVAYQHRVQVLDVRGELQGAEPPWLAFGVRNVQDHRSRVFATRRAAAFELLAGYSVQPDVRDLRPLGDQLQLPTNRIRLDIPEAYRQEGHVHACYGSDFGFEVLAMFAIREGYLQRTDRHGANRARRRDRADERSG